jgi:hypothetical protein
MMREVERGLKVVPESGEEDRKKFQAEGGFTYTIN